MNVWTHTNTLLLYIYQSSLVKSKKRFFFSKWCGRIECDTWRENKKECRSQNVCMRSYKIYITMNSVEWKEQNNTKPKTNSNQQQQQKFVKQIKWNIWMNATHKTWKATEKLWLASRQIMAQRGDQRIYRMRRWQDDESIAVELHTEREREREKYKKQMK